MSASAPAPLIDAAQLHTHYGASHVLHGASIAIGAGEAVGLLGRNGMGKTTLIRTLLGLVRPSRPTASPAPIAIDAPCRTWLAP